MDMEMDKLAIVTTFLHNIVVYNIPLLYGTTGEIVVEKSGSLNLGVEGIMAVGAIFGYLAGCYANSLGAGILTAFLMGALCGLIFAVLTVSLQANQNITGLTLTTFGLGVYFFVGNGVRAQRALCAPVDWADALPGDLAFYPDLSHVGIVAGRGEDGGLLVLHCSYSLGGVVCSSDAKAAGFTDLGRPSLFEKTP